jgi:hypothetical protein
MTIAWVATKLKMSAKSSYDRYLIAYIDINTLDEGKDRKTFGAAQLQSNLPKSHWYINPNPLH